MHVLGLCVALLVSGASSDSRGEHALKYTRSGGWRGMNQALEVKNLRTVVVMEDGLTKSTRPMKPPEAQHLKKLLRDARSSRLLEDKLKGKLADGFEVTLTFDGESKPALLRDALTFPPTGAGPAWDALVKQLDLMLEKELKGPPPKTKKR